MARLPICRSAALPLVVLLPLLLSGCRLRSHRSRWEAELACDRVGRQESKLLAQKKNDYMEILAEKSAVGDLHSDGTDPPFLRHQISVLQDETTRQYLAIQQLDFEDPSKGFTVIHRCYY